MADNKSKISSAGASPNSGSNDEVQSTSSDSVSYISNEFDKIKPLTSPIYSAKDIAKQQTLIKMINDKEKGISTLLKEKGNRAAKLTADLEKLKTDRSKQQENEKEAAEKEFEKAMEQLSSEFSTQDLTNEATKKQYEDRKKALEKAKEEYAEVQRDKYNKEKEAKEEELKIVKNDTASLEAEKDIIDKSISTMKSGADKASKDRIKKISDLAGKKVGFFSVLTQETTKALDALAGENENNKSGYEAVINENIRRAMLARGTSDEDRERMNTIVNNSVNKMYNLQEATEDDFIKQMTAAGATEDDAKAAFKSKQSMVRNKAIFGDQTKGFSGLSQGGLGKVVGAQSGDQVGSALKDTASALLGPMGKLVLDSVTAIFNRMNAIGKEGKELYEKTGGRYGYGQGFDMAQAKGFAQFSGAARNMAFTYAKSADEVKQVFKDMSEYVGVKSFDQMQSLAQSTLKVANATGLASAEVAKLGGSYQKFFGMDSQKAAMTSGRQLLGLMTDINKGMTANLMLSNQQISNLMMKMVEAGEGADVSKTLLPFIGTAQEQLKGLGLQSAYVRDKLAESMMNLKATGSGLPKSMAMFMLGTGNLFQKNRMNSEEQQIAGTEGKFSYEKAKIMANKTTGPAQKFWSSDRLTDETLSTVAFALKGGNIASLLATIGDDDIGNMMKLVFQLYQIEGAEEALGVSMTQVTDQFSNIARGKGGKLKYKLMGGDLASLTSFSQFAEAQRLVKTGKNADGSMATQEAMDKASQNMKSYATQMTPQDRANQFLEKIVGITDMILGTILKIPVFGNTELAESVRGGLDKTEYNKMLMLQQNMNRDEAQSKQLQEYQSKQFKTTGLSKSTVSQVTGDVIQTVEHKGSGQASVASTVNAISNTNPT